MFVSQLVHEREIVRHVTAFFVQEATVLSYDPSSKMVRVEYTEETLVKLKSQSKSITIIR